MDTAPISEFFDRDTSCCDDKAPGGVAGVSSILLDALDDVGLRGRTMLELGCGAGALALELAHRGAGRVTGVDLSPGSIDVARRRARDAGLTGRVTFAVGNAASAKLAPHDVVLSDKAACCFPDAEAFLSNSLPVAGTVYALALPESRGFWGVAARITLGFENLVRRLKRDPFRAFVHDLRKIDAAIRRAGFQPVRVIRHWMWHVAVYARP